MSSLFSKDHPTGLSFSGMHAIGWQVGVHSYAWCPPTDVYETDASFIVRLEVAGMRQSDFSIDVENNFVVIELKVSRGYDRVVGQLLRYMGWIKKKQAEPAQNVRGVIVARDISEDLQLACSEIANVRLFEYQLEVSLKQIN